MSFKDTWQKVKDFDYGAFFGSKAFLIGGCGVIIAAAIVVNALIPSGDKKTGSDDKSQLLGNSVLVDAEQGEQSEESAEVDSYFDKAVIDRENARNEAMDVLQSIADSPDALADAKEQAIQGIAAMAEEMSAEATIEQLVKAKGFSRCVCIVSDGKASVVVETAEELTAAQVAQILEIVYLETGIVPADTKVMSA